MKRIGSCVVTRTDDVDAISFDWGTVHLLSEQRVTGAETFSFGYVELEPGQGHARHNHPTADEVIYVLSGEGDQMLDDEDPIRIRPGDCIWIPEGRFHATINRGDDVMRLIVVYAPAGAEQALREDPASRVTPPAGGAS